jgi:MFS family permease
MTTDLPSNLLLKRFRPSYCICSLTFLWGICAMCQGFLKSGGGLAACRFFIGLLEAGLVPGCAYLMSIYYQRHEMQRRLAFFWSVLT